MPAVLLKEVKGGVYNWIARVWVPSPEHDYYRYMIMEDITLSLEKHGVSTSCALLEGFIQFAEGTLPPEPPKP
eukprot:CAMPEP_0206251418 /NCGR_PEP_ID=MMETSP0047_2-20121206/22016_1 /ASSEMBLY_ACC=CAM_ASM_000192 /TAXON_ID=195065 /ORGANISM="Chroomonas mesostigmatica_cf, Strain CCMP1168" /LENGTH=72 /DNA_ID=CAMNT_0053677375 /DNA_START=244 /DNA_END=462 /DNA_ORIENTATION=+